jgi:nucleoside-diphosphate-sugar epimerase
MRIFFAGASGVIGPSLLPRLLEAGHDVVAMTRTPAKADALRAGGAEPVVCDALDAQATRAAVLTAKPEVVIHHLTDLHQLGASRGSMKRAYAANNEIRRRGTANLLAAAHGAGARRIVTQSISFMYETGPGLRSEDDPLIESDDPVLASGVDSTAAMEQQVLGSEGIEGVVLRFGFWYGPRTAFAPGGVQHSMVAKRRYPVVGRGSGVFSFIHVDDVAEATMLAMDRGAPGTYNVTDDDPAPLREWLPEYAEAIGAKPPRRIPTFLARLAAGKAIVHAATRMPGASSHKAKAELGWSPHWHTWRTGFREALG